MTPITDTDLSGRSDVELAVLFQVVSEALADTAPGTPERRTVIDSLQTIGEARSARHRASAVPGL